MLKLGGELLDDAAADAAAAAAIVRARGAGAARGRARRRAGDRRRAARAGRDAAFVDGLRITDAPTLDAVVSVLAGRTNTALVAAIGAGGGRAVGLTGRGRSDRPLHQGRRVHDGCG